jgi:hypothetical protein
MPEGVAKNLGTFSPDNQVGRIVLDVSPLNVAEFAYGPLVVGLELIQATAHHELQRDFLV